MPHGGKRPGAGRPRKDAPPKLPNVLTKKLDEPLPANFAMPDDATANAMVRANLFRIAVTGIGREARMAGEFWLRSQAGWSEFKPAPVALKPAESEHLGKKEQAELDALTAGTDNDWGRLVN